MPQHRATRHAARSLLGLCLPLGLHGCGGSARQEAARASDEARTDEADGAASLPAGGLDATWRELAVPGVGIRPALASSPTGFLALSRRELGDAKAPSAWQSYLYRSTDGARWQRVEVSDDNDNLWLRGVAYGGGQYVLAGMRFGGGDGVIFRSTDGERWDEMPVVTGAPSGLSDVVFTGGRFFALSTFRTLLTSSDGASWTAIDLRTTVMPLDVAFGAGQFLLVGSGDVQRSVDGRAWVPAQLDCAMPGACITDPGGGVSRGLRSHAVFSGGTFFIDQASSTDGQAWQSLPGQYPLAALAGYVVGYTETDALAIWSAGQPPRPLASLRYLDTLSDDDRSLGVRWNGAVNPDELLSEAFPDDAPPASLEFPIAGGKDCVTSSCVIVGERLFLVADEP